MKTRHAFPPIVAALLLAVSGCNETALNSERKTTFLTADDLVAMTDKMAQSILADPQVQAVIAEKPMTIVLKPIQNETNEIIRTGEKQLYVHRVRVLLSTKPELRQKFVFVLNRDDYENLRQQEGVSSSELGLTEERVQPEYALTGTFYANTNITTKNRSDTYLCTFRLTKLQGEATGIQLWEGSYETSKHVKKEFLD
jgi:hypothetical protein